MRMNNKQVLKDAHLDEQVETAIYHFIKENIHNNREYSLYDIEKSILEQGWGYLPTTVFLQCYRKAINHFTEELLHPQESLV